MAESAQKEINNAIHVLTSKELSNHYLWSNDTLFATPSKMDFLRKVKTTGLSNLNSDEWNSLMFSCAYTIGDNRSFEYLLPIYLEKVFNNEIEIVHFESDQLFSKLEYVEYKNWPQSKTDAANTLLRHYKEKEEVL